MKRLLLLSLSPVPLRWRMLVLTKLLGLVLVLGSRRRQAEISNFIRGQEPVSPLLWPDSAPLVSPSTFLEE